MTDKPGPKTDQATGNGAATKPSGAAADTAQADETAGKTQPKAEGTKNAKPVAEQTGNDATKPAPEVAAGKDGKNEEGGSKPAAPGGNGVEEKDKAAENAGTIEPPATPADGVGKETPKEAEPQVIETEKGTKTAAEAPGAAKGAGGVPVDKRNEATGTPAKPAAAPPATTPAKGAVEEISPKSNEKKRKAQSVSESKSKESQKEEPAEKKAKRQSTTT